MKGLLRFSIMLSVLIFTSFTTASPSSPGSGSGLGPDFEPNIGESQKAIDMQTKYRSLLEGGAALKDEVCPMCIQASSRAGESLTVEDRLRIKTSLGEERFETFLAVRQELKKIKSQSYEQRAIPQHMARIECSKVLNHLVLVDAVGQMKETMMEISPTVSTNGGYSKVVRLGMHKKAIASFIKDLSTGVIEYNCEGEF